MDQDWMNELKIDNDISLSSGERINLNANGGIYHLYPQFSFEEEKVNRGKLIEADD
ncbi:MAG: hypothetical protein ABI091_06665 [Ferruginibacter sp.]